MRPFCLSIDELEAFVDQYNISVNLWQLIDADNVFVIDLEG
jgi:hypothetical protein